MFVAALILAFGLCAGIKLVHDAAVIESPGMGFAGVIVTMISGLSLVLLLLGFAIGLR